MPHRHEVTVLDLEPLDLIVESTEPHTGASETSKPGRLLTVPRRKMAIAAAVLVGVTALITSAVTGGSGGAAATGATTTTTSATTATTTRSAGSLVANPNTLQPGSIAYRPAQVPAGMKLTSVYAFSQAIDANVFLPEVNGRSFVSPDGRELLVVHAGPVPGNFQGVYFAGIPAEIMMGSIPAKLYLGLHGGLSWTDRTTGVAVSVEAVDVARDRLVFLASTLRFVRQSSTVVDIVPSEFFRDWHALPLAATDRSVNQWLLGYEAGTSQDRQLLQLRGSLRNSLEIDSMAFAIQIGAMPTRERRGDKTVLWFENSAVDASDLLRTTGPIRAALWQDGTQTMYMVSTLDQATMQTLLDHLVTVTSDQWGPLEANRVDSVLATDTQSTDSQYLLGPQEGDREVSVLQYGVGRSKRYCLQIGGLLTDSIGSSIPAGDVCVSDAGGPVVLARAAQMSDGHVRAVGIVRDTVTSVQVIPDVGPTVSAQFLTDVKLPSPLRAFRVELPPNAHTAALEFVEAGGKVSARIEPDLQAWRTVRPILDGVGYSPMAESVLGFTFAGYPVKFSDGVTGRCLQMSGGQPGSRTAIGKLGCGVESLNPTLELPEYFVGESDGHVVVGAVMPPDALTAELVYVFGPPESATIAYVGGHRIAVAVSGAVGELPLELRFRAPDGHVVTAVAVASPTR